MVILEVFSSPNDSVIPGLHSQVQSHTDHHEELFTHKFAFKQQGFVAILLVRGDLTSLGSRKAMSG